MKRLISLIIGISILLSVPCAPVFVGAVVDSTTTDTTDSTTTDSTEDPATTSSTIQALLDQINTLKSQILALQTRLQEMKKSASEVKEAKEQVKQTLRITRQLWQGLSNEDVKLLQETLATDPDIYPEGLTTGYFGPLTYAAVKRFQKKAGIEQVGRVGPKTLSKLNQLLQEGAGKSGKIPPGLLIAPGIKKKINFIPEPLPGQKLPYGICKKLGITISCGTEEEEEPGTTTDEESGTTTEEESGTTTEDATTTE